MVLRQYLQCTLSRPLEWARRLFAAELKWLMPFLVHAGGRHRCNCDWRSMLRHYKELFSRFQQNFHDAKALGELDGMLSVAECEGSRDERARIDCAGAQEG